MDNILSSYLNETFNNFLFKRLFFLNCVFSLHAHDEQGQKEMQRVSNVLAIALLYMVLGLLTCTHLVLGKNKNKGPISPALDYLWVL